MRGPSSSVKKQYLIVSAAILLLTGCSSAASPDQPDTPAPALPTEKPEQAQPAQPDQPPKEAAKPAEGKTTPAAAPPGASTGQKNPPAATKPPSNTPTPAAPIPELEVVGEPQSMTVLVNKQRQLPDQYQPTDLVSPHVPFLLPEKSEKRQMRKEAAKALEQLFAAAKADGVALAGVSAYRPYGYQKALFHRYVQKDGLEKARMYSAVPGTSEHETGLAVDVAGIDGKCAATSCFAGTQEAIWLASHAQDYGFIIRYPKGKEDITGYIYEPWHLRYVGSEAAQAISEKEITLEEYLGVASVSAKKK